MHFCVLFCHALRSINFGISVGRGRLGNPFMVEHPIDPRTGVPVAAAITIEVSDATLQLREYCPHCSYCLQVVSQIQEHDWYMGATQ